MKTDYYEILGISAEATPEELKTAYRRRAQELHPDHLGPGSEPFLAVQKAYAVLSDPQQREAYDERRRTARQSRTARRRAAEPFRPRRGAPEPIRATEQACEAGEVSPFESFRTYTPSFDELFERFWSNFDPVSRPKAEALESLTLEIPLTPDQARLGGQMKVMIPARADCPSCHGHGAVGAYQCWRCEGHGSITSEYPLEVAYPAGLLNEYSLQVPLKAFGIENFYLTLRFRVSASTD